jgi:hypothetical protein
MRFLALFLLSTDFFPLPSFYPSFPVIFFPFVLSAILSKLLVGQIEAYNYEFEGCLFL